MSEEIRIIKKKKGGHGGGHHGGAWKVAYADFVTAMMAFFLVMWICGMNQSVKDAVAAYFKDPIGFMRAAESGKNPFSVESPGIMSSPDVKPDIRKDTLGMKSPAGKGKDEERKRFEKVRSELQKLIVQHPEFKELERSISVKVSPEGLRIDLIESSSNLFFDSGSAAMKSKTKSLLQQIAAELGTMPNLVVIEGHTDSLPYHGPMGWTNWELSAARANAARAVMEVSGLRSGQIIEVRGLADTMPLDPNHKDSFKNRRVSIMLKAQTT